MNLTEIKAAAEAATPGPWRKVASAYDPEGFFVEPEVSGAGSEADAAFIALSREAVPWLVERVEELAAEARRHVCPLVFTGRTTPRASPHFEESEEGATYCRMCAALARLEGSP